MRLAVDADLVGKNKSGNEVFTRGVVNALGAVLHPEHDSLILAGSDRDTLESMETGGANRELLITRPGLVGNLELGRALTQAKADAVLASYTAPLMFSGIVATVVHDVAYARVPETFPWRLRTQLRLTVRRSARVSDLLVTVSEFSRHEILDLYPKVATEAIVVAPNAAGEGFFRDNISPASMARVRQHYALPERFVLTVGNLQPRKNVPRLIAATRDLGLPLVIVGQRLWNAHQIERHFDQHVVWLGYVPDDDLPALYAASSVFAYPSLYEGFGLPLIEAMAAGTPVVTSDRGAMREVAANAAVLVNPESTEEIARGLSSVITDAASAEDLSKAGIVRAREFRWDVAARRIVAGFRRRLARGEDEAG